MSTLYIVATPIGNLEDMTLRAIRILKEVDVIACEDTRTTKVLLNHYEIKTPTTSYHSHSTKGKEEHIIDLLKDGKDVALVSDAGTPAISDPGVLLVERVHNELGGDVKIVAVPGASALTSAYSISGISGNEFIFLGFLPHKKGRDTLFNEIKDSKRTIAFYESPHRIMKTLEELYSRLDEKRIVSVGRELTKQFEEVVRGSAEMVRDYFVKNEEKVRGEFVVIVSGK